MARPTRSMRIARSFRFAMVSFAALAVAACAAILGIDDREPVGTVGTDAPLGDSSSDGLTADRDGDADGSTTTDAATADGPTADAKPSCDPTACTGVGGTCSGLDVCVVACNATTCPNIGTVKCPAGHDCRLTCHTNGCDKIRCVGGRSCTIDCGAAMSCHNGASCQSERCEILCTGLIDSCGGGGGADPVLCEAGVCLVTCSGSNSCSAGVIVKATSYCGISCTGNPSCTESAVAPVTCGTSPDASIVCGSGPKTCEHGKPSCFGGNCSIQCLGPDSCQDGHCCEAGACAINAPTRPSVCP